MANTAATTLAADQLLELLLQLKKTTPDSMKQILNGQPAIAYALITLMVSMNAINFDVFQKILAEYSASQSAGVEPPPSMATIPLQGQPQKQYQPPAPSSSQTPSNSWSSHSHLPAQPPPAKGTLESVLENIPDHQKQMILTVLQMSQEQINALPLAQRQSVMQLRSTFKLP